MRRTNMQLDCHLAFPVAPKIYISILQAGLYPCPNSPRLVLVGGVYRVQCRATLSAAGRRSAIDRLSSPLMHHAVACRPFRLRFTVTEAAWLGDRSTDE
jgi:hypothetical protein